MKNHHKCLYVFLSLTVFLSAVILSYRALPHVPYSDDEVSWFFHTGYFDLLFLKQDVSNPEWNAYEAFDHPPLVKYIFGGVLWIFDPSFGVKRDAIKKEVGRWDFYTDTKFSISAYPYLVTELNILRLYQTIVIGLVMVLLWFLVTVLTRNIFFSLIAIALLLTNSLFLTVLLRATPDATMALFCTSAVLAYITFRKKIISFILIGLFLGMALSSKITAISLVFGFSMYWIITWFMEKQNRNTLMKEISIIFLTMFATWIVVNPTLYRNIIGQSYRYMSFRREQSIILQINFPTSALYTPFQRVEFTICNLNIPCGEREESGRFGGFFLFHLIFLLTGIFTFSRRLYNFRRLSPVSLMLLCISVEVTLITVAFLPLAYSRYLVPIIPFAWAGELYGIWVMLRQMQLFGRNKLHR